MADRFTANFDNPATPGAYAGGNRLPPPGVTPAGRAPQICPTWMSKEVFEVARNDPYHAFDASRAKIAELQQRVAVKRKLNQTLLQDPQYQYAKALRNFDKLKKDHIALNDQYNDLESVNETLQEVIEVLRGDKHKLLVELNAIRRELMIQNIENDQLDQKSRQVVAFIESVDLKLHSQEAQLQSLEEDEKAARGHLAELAREITALEATCQNLSLQSTSLSDLRQHLETTRVAQDRAVQALEREVQGKVQEVVEHDAQLWEFKREMSGRVLALQKKAQECADEFGRLQRLAEHEMATLASQNHAMNDELSATADTLFATRKEKADFSTAAKKELTQRREEVSQCIAVIDLLERQNQGLEAAIARLVEQNRLSEKQIVEKDAINHKNLIEQSNFLAVLHMELQTTREDLYLLKARLCHHCRETILADEVAEDRMALAQAQSAMLQMKDQQSLGAVDGGSVLGNAGGEYGGGNGGGAPGGALSEAERKRYEEELRKTRDALEALNRKLLEERAQHERERKEAEELAEQEEMERHARQMEDDARRRRTKEDEKKIASGEEQQTYTIRFMDGSRKKVEAFRSDTIMDLILRVCTMLSIRQGEHLFYLAHSVNENSVLGAVDRFLDKGKTIEAEGINPKCNLVFKFKHYKRHRKWSDGNAQEWFFKQIHRNVITEYYPTTEKLAVELASYELQSVHGDATGKKRHAYFDKIGLDSYLPVSVSAHDYEYWQERLYAMHKKRAGLSAVEARSRYVETFASRSPYWGMTFFDVRDKENQPFLAGIAEDGLYLFSASKKELLLSLPFGKLAGWERSPSGIFIKQRGASKMTLFASSKLQSKEMCDLLNEYYTMLPQQVRETLGTVIENQEELRSKLPGSEVFQMPQVDRKRPVEFYSRLEFLKYAYLDQCHRNGLDGVPQQPIKKFTQAMDKALDEGRPFEILDLSNTDVDDAQIAIIRELFFYTMDQLHATDTDQFEENVAPTTISVAHAEKNARLTEHCAANLFDLMAKFSVNITSVNLSSIPLDRTETDLGNTLVAMKNLQVLVLKSCKLKTKTFIAVMQVFSIVPSKLHTLDVEHNDLTEASVSQLCNYIESSNCALTNLNISHNRVDASGLESIITTVKRQQRLKVLNYAGNAAVPASKLADLVAARAGITDLDISFLHLSGEGAVRITEELRGKGQLAKLNLSNNPIGKTLRRELNAGNGEVNRDLPAAFVAFLDVSSYSDVKVLTLDECELHEDAGLALAGVLQSNTKLAELYLNKNNLAAKTGMLPGAWTDMLPVNQTLQKLHLSYNNIQYPGLKAIFQAMTRNQGITELKLDGNNFDRYPVNTPHTEIVNFFEANQTVQTLSICNMFIKDDVLRKIGEGLRKNRGLRTLLAFSNEVTYQGVVDFARCLPENTTLESLDLSCHSVQSSEDLYLQAYKMLIDQSNLESVLL